MLTEGRARHWEHRMSSRWAGTKLGWSGPMQIKLSNLFAKSIHITILNKYLLDYQKISPDSTEKIHADATPKKTGRIPEISPKVNCTTDPEKCGKTPLKSPKR